MQFALEYNLARYMIWVHTDQELACESSSSANFPVSSMGRTKIFHIQFQMFRLINENSKRQNW